jgi:hypothetical protein
VSVRRSVSEQEGYVLTERGRLDLETAEECECSPRLAGLLIECPECGTIYGSVRDSVGRLGSSAEFKSWHR